MYNKIELEIKCKAKLLSKIHQNICKQQLYELMV